MSTILQDEFATPKFKKPRLNKDLKELIAFSQSQFAFIENLVEVNEGLITSLSSYFTVQHKGKNGYYDLSFFGLKEKISFDELMTYFRNFSVDRSDFLKKVLSELKDYIQHSTVDLTVKWSKDELFRKTSMLSSVLKDYRLELRVLYSLLSTIDMGKDEKAVRILMRTRLESSNRYFTRLGLKT